MAHKPVFSISRGALSALCKWMCVLVMTCMLVIISSQVALRNLFLLPMSWAQELSQYMMIYLALFGSVFVLHEKGHLHVDTLVILFPDGLQRAIRAAILALQATFFAAIVWYSIGALGYAANVQAISLGVSMWMPYLALPVAFGLMLLETLFQFIDALRGCEAQDT